MSFRAELNLEFRFDAAHKMADSFEPGHPNARLHGHSYYGHVTVVGTVDPANGFVTEVDALKARVNEVVGELEHRLLNDIPGLEIPSSELIARWIWRRLVVPVPQIKSVTISRPSVGMSVTYRGEDFVS